MMNALMHDNDETITGDITGPMKSLIVNPTVAPILEVLTEERMGGLVDAYYDLEEEQTQDKIQEADAIVMVADKLDALLFLIVNKRMGNSCVNPAIEGGMKSLEASWRKLPAPKDLLDKEWQVSILPAIAEHYQRGGRGCAPGAKI